MTLSLVNQAKSLKAFLQYDFTSDARKGKLLAVGKDTHGRTVLKIIDKNQVSFLERTRLFLTGDNDLDSVVRAVQEILEPYVLQNKKTLDTLEWRTQIAHLRKKVKRYNESALTLIDFRNRWKNTFELTICKPGIPQDTQSKTRYFRHNIKIPYSPLSTFEKVEKFLKKAMPYEECYREGKSGERTELKTEARKRTKMHDWVSKHHRDSILLTYDSLNYHKYLRCCTQTAYENGLQKGFSEACLRLRGVRSDLAWRQTRH